ncbi:hypothetical protein PYW08_006233 [Mythimna loreyi]|uniref:Uncharacterized protein n=1 Tax=Mythimna loreyi TaxID=667449 RepID=A0ACC2QS67_9NEOP|nr:hypothetical protein PYW08_006233 [Mythimna loreyi]
MNRQIVFIRIVQLVAIVLKKITPLSPRWRAAIEQRIAEGRHLTLQAVSQGARIHPGQYWDLSGTFLFTIFVMTALGFGAPVPQTTGGRTSALIYSMLAVPVHFCLFLNASMCIVVRVEMQHDERRRSLQDERPFVLGRTIPQTGESPNCSRSSEVLKAYKRGVGKKIMRFLSVLGACRSFILFGILYYMCGVAAFGLARGNSALDVALFPLEFTTSGGLDSVKGHVRILYGWYVEGAMMLMSCGLATFRRNHPAGALSFLEKYRLFETDNSSY